MPSTAAAGAQPHPHPASLPRHPVGRSAVPTAALSRDDRTQRQDRRHRSTSDHRSSKKLHQNQSTGLGTIRPHPAGSQLPDGRGPRPQRLHSVKTLRRRASRDIISLFPWRLSAVAASYVPLSDKTLLLDPEETAPIK